MEGRSERSAEELMREADAVASGELTPGEFAADLDWALPSISRDGGPYASQIVSMITDATDELALGRAELTPDAARSLAAAALLAARQGERPESVANAHGRLVAGGLRPAGPPPEPRPNRVVRAEAAGGRSADGQTVAGGAGGGDAGRSGGGSGSGERAGAPTGSVDPAIDPEVARLARRVSPSRSSLQPMRILGLGWAVVLSLVFGLLAGLWLDNRFGTSPILTVVGLVIGLLLAAQTARQLIDETRRQ
jgi:hypothetical protein